MITGEKGIIDQQDKALIKSARTEVVKANELIQRTRFSLSAQEQKIILYLISKISQYDTELKTYKFYIPEFCRLVGINEKNGGNYSVLKKTIKQLSDKSFWLKIDADREVTIRWISKAAIQRNSGILEIRLDDDLAPYLIKLKRNYTKWMLMYSLHFKSKYSLRLYEIIKSVQYNELADYTKTYELSELKRLLDAEKYDRWSNFEARVLKPAIDEINAESDKTIAYVPKKEKYSNKYSKVELTIQSKSVDEQLKVDSRIEEELGLVRHGTEDNNQLSLFEDEDFREEIQ